MKRISWNAKSVEEWDEIFQRFNPNISVVKEMASKNKRRYLLCYCSDCGQTFERSTSKYKQTCPICNNKKVAVGINDMATTAPWMLKYLKDINDGFKYTKSCSHKTTFKCPDCGYEKEYRINNVYNFGFSCDICGDGISRPNKFARSLFIQLPVQNLVFEYSSKWTKGKKYDVYFEYNNLKYIVEMDGEQHFADSQWGKLVDQQNNDNYKTRLAEDNGIHLIRIPCHYLDYQGMIDAFYSCELSNLIKENNVDWEKCILNADKSYMSMACEYFNNNISITEISKMLNVDKTTIRRYLKVGAELNLCNYNPNKPKRKKKENRQKGNNRVYSEEDILKNPLFYKVCEYGNLHNDALYSEFTSEFNITKYKVKQYLNFGREHGYTEHSYSLMKKKITKIANDKQRDKLLMVVETYNDDKLIGKYTSYQKCVDALNKLYPNRHYERHKLGSLLKENKEVIYKNLKFVSLKKRKEQI